MTVTITFLGAAGTVTGSKYLVEGRSARILVDAGLFQGSREWRERNWVDHDTLDVRSLDGVLLTHAHIDHAGMLPRFSAQGLSCPVYCSAPTRDLSKIMLPDSGRLQEEEAEWRNKKGRSRHHPALPLYTEKDAVNVLRLFKSVPLHTKRQIAKGVTAEWGLMGHILGACSIRVEIDDKVIVFSGDIGRYNVPILKDPEPVDFGDLLLIESTYGDREHGEEDPKRAIQKIVKSTVARDGVVVIPSFAVGRAQLLLFYLRELKEEGLIPDIPVIIDSPMAESATEIYQRYPEEYDPAVFAMSERGRDPFAPSKLYFIKDSEESKKLNRITEPMIIISASGMLSGGRILHHLRHRISSPKNTVLFVGYQPPGGRGEWILRGEKTFRLLGEDVPIRAKIENISGLSAHGDKSEMLAWCRSCQGTPGRVAVVHGEPEAAESFSRTLHGEFGWDTFVPVFGEKITL